MFEYLICVGAMKAGTTLLHDLLKNHPRIRSGFVKELHYFDNTQQPDKSAYDALYKAGDGIKMDVTPIYMYDPAVLPRITSVLDPASCGIIVLLRDPVERAFSHYKMRLSQNLETASFEQCFLNDSERTGASAHDHRMFSYFTRGLYAAQLERLYQYFPRENIKIFLFEDFIKNQQSIIHQVCAFAGLDEFDVSPRVSNPSITHFKSNRLAVLLRKLSRLTPTHLKTDWLRDFKHWLMKINEDKTIRDEIPSHIRQQLKAYYSEDVLRLKNEFGIDISKWKNFRDLN